MVGISLFYTGDDFFEDTGMADGQGRKDFAIEVNTFGFERSHEFAVGKSKGTNSSVDADVPQFAVDAFFHAATVESVLTGFHFGHFGHFNFRFATPHVALGMFENTAAAFGVE